MFDNISSALIGLIQTRTKIQEVYDYEASKITGYPAAIVIPAGNENAYSTTTENRRIYAFVIRLYTERGSTPAAEKQCEKTMRDMVDSVLDVMDLNYSSINISCPTGYTFLFMHATPSTWGYAGRETEMRFAEVKVQLEFDVDVNLIS